MAADGYRYVDKARALSKNVQVALAVLAIELSKPRTLSAVMCEGRVASTTVCGAGDGQHTDRTVTQCGGLLGLSPCKVVWRKNERSQQASKQERERGNQAAELPTR